VAGGTPRRITNGDAVKYREKEQSSQQSPLPATANETMTRPCWHQRTVAETLTLLASARTGLTAEEATRRYAQLGPNALDEPPSRSLLAMLGAQFADLMIMVLISAAVISGVIGDIADTLVIAAIVLLNAALGFFQEFRAERAMAALKTMAAPAATVLRGGHPTHVAAAELVPGDVVLLDAGGIIPADLRLIEAASLRVNESALTGEAMPVDKTIDAIAVPDLSVGDRSNIAYMSTFITYGRGVGLVVETGMRTEIGRIANLLQRTATATTPLQRRLTVFGRRLAIVVLLICAVVFVAGLLRGEPAIPLFLTALSLAVAAIPEALPAILSMSLALGARKMAAAKALIRRLPAVETLGSVTFICSDKTGTLTTNQMQVARYYCDGESTTAVGTRGPWDALRLAMAVSHDARVDAAGRFVGDPTEVALLRAAQEAGLDYATAETQFPRAAEIPFDSSRKCMTTIHRQSDGTFLAITKGAAEVLLERSSFEQRTSGLVPLERSRLRGIADSMAADGLRVIAIAMRRWKVMPQPLMPGTAEADLEWVGIVGLIDPPRTEAREAIDECRSAGITPVMITGDHPATARAIARQLGLLESGDGAVLTGTELTALSDPDLRQRVRDVHVYARVAPEQKVRIVMALRANGEVVAMTGDGVNDAPALRQADIGVAMGITGTDVAREASAMVLLDDNFATIVKAVREGRRIYDNLRRFVRYVLTTNSAEIWTIFLAPFLGLPIPLLPIQILWINLLTDGLPGLALISEPGEQNLMRRPPRPPAESLFAHGLGAHAFLVGLLMAGLVLGVQAWYVHAQDPAWQTTLFTALCFAQLGHVLAVRSERTSLLSLGLTSNRPLLGAVIITIALQLAVVYVPALNRLFRTVPIAPEQLAVCMGCGLAILAVVEVEKWTRRRQSEVDE
jgi:Ca2+-transporting ATPase